MKTRLWELCELAKAGRPSTLITLTVDPKAFADPHEAARRLVHGWRMIRQRLEREHLAAKLQYLAVFEQTKAGWPHLHILCRCGFIDQKYLSDMARQFIRSPIVDIRTVKNRRQAARYVAKYVSKGPGAYEGTKRYFRSMSWVKYWEGPPKPVSDMARNWQMVRYSVDAICGMHERYDWLLVEENGGATLYPTDMVEWLWPHIKPPPGFELVEPGLPYLKNGVLRNGSRKLRRK